MKPKPKTTATSYVAKVKRKAKQYFTLVVNCPIHGATSLTSMFMAGVRLNCGCSFHATNHNGQGWQLAERGPNKPMDTDAKVLIALREWSKKCEREDRKAKARSR